MKVNRSSRVTKSFVTNSVTREFNNVIIILNSDFKRGLPGFSFKLTEFREARENFLMKKPKYKDTHSHL